MNPISLEDTGLEGAKEVERIFMSMCPQMGVDYRRPMLHLE